MLVERLNFPLFTDTCTEPLGSLVREVVIHGSEYQRCVS